MRLYECTNEDALDLIADLIAPFSKLTADEEVQKAIKSNAPKLLIGEKAIRANKTAIIEILATLEGVPVEDYHNTAIGMLKDLVIILNNEDIQSLFS